jgi:steroid delta-isomerase-like uncharacterized protein
MTTNVESLNRAVVRRHYDEAWNRRDLGSIAETHAPDCVHHDPSNPVPMQGIEALRAQLRAVQQAFPDVQITVHDLVAEGDLVAVRWTLKGTQREPFAGIPATGRTVSVGGMIMHRLREGKIVEDHTVRDTLGLLTQLGVMARGPAAH